MKDLDNKIEKIRFSVYPGEYIISTHKEVYVAIPDEVIKQIKSVILEALKAEMPKRKKSVENMGNEMGGSFIGDDYNELYRAEDFGYNEALSDCLNVCNKLLGDSNGKTQ